MQKFTQKYTIVSLIESADEGYEFASNTWPLHTTIADTFSMGCPAEQLIEHLSRFAASKQTVSSVATETARFGARGEVTVTLIKNTPELQELHEDLVALLNSVEVVFNDPQYTGDGFTPHATVQAKGRLTKSQTVHIDNLALIDMFPGDDAYQRKVLKVCRLMPEVKAVS